MYYCKDLNCAGMIEDAKAAIIEALTDGEYSGYYCDLHDCLFNEDYHYCYTSEAEDDLNAIGCSWRNSSTFACWRVRRIASDAVSRWMLVSDSTKCSDGMSARRMGVIRQSFVGSSGMREKDRWHREKQHLPY